MALRLLRFYKAPPFISITGAVTGKSNNLSPSTLLGVQMHRNKNAKYFFSCAGPDFLSALSITGKKIDDI
jgi:hypothetical protein